MSSTDAVIVLAEEDSNAEVIAKAILDGIVHHVSGKNISQIAVLLVWNLNYLRKKYSGKKCYGAFQLYRCDFSLFYGVLLFLPHPLLLSSVPESEEISVSPQEQLDAEVPAADAVAANANSAVNTSHNGNV